MGDVLPVGVVHEPVKGRRSLRQGSNHCCAWTALTGGIRVIVEDGTLHIRLYSVPALLGCFRLAHSKSLWHESECNAQLSGRAPPGALELFSRRKLVS